ncbi:LysM peptidoglycan-binding domain-containing protein [Agromyces sp. S2-1-8]|jgi:hypothetical protein|uniref:LysM peptidoglycan-binding domain-containing protein n=1 Tax=unclassified Agromyces TaxID=2639701 RepID=UPI001E5A3B91|nr:LysM peptidoglycan-binding domain-containing protein [Agromyces sp. S2-1-8]MCD5347464.1 LysM peptidoglycan-binding domain-containing protein [Agromyces sp. S2-1-8]
MSAAIVTNEYRSGVPVPRAGRVDGGAEAAPRTRLRLTRRGRAVFTTLAALPIVLWALAAVLNAGGAAADLAGGDSLQYVTVGAGGSLWEIAEAIDPSADPRDTIAEIVRLNGLDGATIEPGQRLAVPASE